MEKLRGWFDGLGSRARVAVLTAAAILLLTLVYVVKPFSVSIGTGQIPCGPAVLTYGEQQGIAIRRTRSPCADAARSRLFTAAVVGLLTIGGAVGAIAWFDEDRQL